MDKFKTDEHKYNDKQSLKLLELEGKVLSLLKSQKHRVENLRLASLKKEYYRNFHKRKLQNLNLNPYVDIFLEEKKNKELIAKSKETKEINLRKKMLEKRIQADIEYSMKKDKEEEVNKIKLKTKKVNLNSQARKYSLYLKAVTLTKTDIIDPGGRNFHFFPSEVTTFT